MSSLMRMIKLARATVSCSLIEMSLINRIELINYFFNKNIFPTESVA